MSCWRIRPGLTCTGNRCSPNDGGHGTATPGEFGARASGLYHMLKEGHHDVQLSGEDMHRIVLWLDSVSLFYGVYEQEGGEAQL